LSSKAPTSIELTYIDLFAGCGGLSLGLHNAGWKGLFAIEKSPHAFETLNHNLILGKEHFLWPKWLPKTNLEIDSVLKKYKTQLRALSGTVDMVVGGPPCQGFSTAGRRKEDDVRNGLIKSYLRFIGYVQPKIIFFENVKGFTLGFEKNKSEGRVYSNYVLGRLKRLGYEVSGKMVDFSDFGIPQKRMRFILVGVRKDIAKEKKIAAEDFFKQLTANRKGFLSGKGLPQSPNLGSAVSDLLMSNGVVDTPDRKRFKSGTYSVPKSKYQSYLRTGATSSAPDSHSFANHTNSIVRRFKHFLKHETKNKKLSTKARAKYNLSKHSTTPLARAEKTPTLTTLPDDYIHYEEPRILTVREYARIQSFPDWYEFKGKYTSGGKVRVNEVPRYTQIGNAIPPLFGEQSGLILGGFLMSAI
jgi:DNA (cytosine-5)-methyltransferase 1